ncbi:MAG: hypothetical protein KAS62_10815, partial [Candidatus Delongbacteria bacterium]|nr:hypothetical protein [Candidatus Delongbacteria bacterium]
QNKYRKELWINKHNFADAPKGTGCLFIKRELFLNSLPEDRSKDTSDDTKILKDIIFKNDKKILRHTDIVAKYNQRIESDIYSWIHHRGRIWADHYLNHINKYSIAYSILNFILIILLLKSFSSFIGMLFILFFMSAILLAENSKDILIVLRLLPVLSFRFYAGTLEKLYKRIRGSFK